MTHLKHQSEIDRIYEKLEQTEPGSQQYTMLVNQLNELNKHEYMMEVKSAETYAESLKAHKARELVYVQVVAKVAAIGMVLYFERSGGAIISKAFGLVRD